LNRCKTETRSSLERCVLDFCSRQQPVLQAESDVTCSPAYIRRNSQRAQWNRRLAVPRFVTHWRYDISQFTEPNFSQHKSTSFLWVRHFTRAARCYV